MTYDIKAKIIQMDIWPVKSVQIVNLDDMDEVKALALDLLHADKLYKEAMASDSVDFIRYANDEFYKAVGSLICCRSAKVILES